MTTDPVAPDRWNRHGALRAVGILVLIAAGWFVFMAGFMLVSEAAPAALVIAPRAGFLDNAPRDTQLMRGGETVLVVAPGRDGYVRRLYASGAWLVLPALRNGCLDLSAAGPVSSNG